MNEHDRVDLSALDVASDAPHWDAVMATTLLRVDAVLARRAQDPLSLIASWRRPLLLATAVTIALLVPAELALEMREARAEQVQRLVTLSSEWERGQPPPSSADFLRALAAAGAP